jgi:hypothetical protein
MPKRALATCAVDVTSQSMLRPFSRGETQGGANTDGENDLRAVTDLDLLQQSSLNT